MSRTHAIATFVMVALVAVVAWAVLRDPVITFDGPATFIGRSVCAECHAKEHERWQGSHHDLAMDHATSETVRGDFDDAEFTHHGVTSRFTTRNGKYFVRTDGPDGEMADFQIKYVFGYEPLQQYLIELPKGRVQCLQVSWDTEAKRWFHIFDEPTPHGDLLHWTSMQFNYNFMCAECHSTNLQRGYDAATNSYATTWSEIDVSCEACHGPGSHHETWARKGEDPRVASMGLEVQFNGNAADVQIDHCARCHSRRTHVSREYSFGQPLLDQYAPRLLVEPLYYPDGQILDEVYVYGSFAQSKMHAAGVRCTDCHDPHSGRLKHEGDKVCTQCHSPEGHERFPTLRKATYDDVKHHFHPDASKTGRACVDCHMEARTYMQVDPRRDHSFRIPRPDLTDKIGTPNACNNCHKDKTPAWAVAETGKHLPDFLTGRVAARHYGEVFSLARAGDEEAIEPLDELARDEGAAAIVRATAVEYLSRFPSPDALAAVADRTQDPDGLVRAAAARALRSLVSPQAHEAILAKMVDVLAPLLRDPLRLVRTDAARALAGLPADVMSAQQRTVLDAALAEYVDNQKGLADRAEGLANLALLRATLGAPREAEAFLRRAVEVDPHFAPARLTLATLLSGQGRNQEAETVLEAAVTQNPKDGEAWYALGLLRAEMKNTAGAILALRRAEGLVLGRARIRYNLGLLLLKSGDAAEADRILTTAHAEAPRDPDILQALISVASQRGDEQRARTLARKLRALGRR